MQILEMMIGDDDDAVYHFSVLLQLARNLDQNKSRQQKETVYPGKKQALQMVLLLFCFSTSAARLNSLFSLFQ